MNHPQPISVSDYHVPIYVMCKLIHLKPSQVPTNSPWDASLSHRKVHRKGTDFSFTQGYEMTTSTICETVYPEKVKMVSFLYNSVKQKHKKSSSIQVIQKTLKKTQQRHQQISTTTTNTTIHLIRHIWVIYLYFLKVDLFSSCQGLARPWHLDAYPSLRRWPMFWKRKGKESSSNHWENQGVIKF